MVENADPFVDPATLYVALFTTRKRSAAIEEFVKGHKYFDEIKDNQIVLPKLQCFLEAVQARRQAEREINELTRFERGFLRPSKKLKELQANLARLDKELVDAHNELEMIRKLALPDNTLLQFQCHQLTTSSKNGLKHQAKP